MKNLLKATLSATTLIAFTLVGCSSSVDTGASDPTIEDLTGIYRTDSSSTVPSVTSVEIFNGLSETDLEAVVLRNGLSDEEKAYFNVINEVQFVDSRLGREITLKNFKEGSLVKNELVGDLSLINVCSDKVELNSRSMDLQYCLYMIRQQGSLKAIGELVLNIFEFGEKVHEIKNVFTVFTKDRWFVEFYGKWGGEISFRNGNLGGLALETGQNLEVTFQPVTETSFILRPVDSNQFLNYAGERYILMPATRDMTELENSANPYINFIYVSEVDGVRQVHFNSHVRQTGLIEGNITAVGAEESVITLGTYTLEQK
jgi:hypothetical protein